MKVGVAVTFAAALSASGLASCGRAAPAVPGGAPEPVRTVRVGSVERTGGAVVQAVPAVVAARQRATLASRVSGTVVALPFREGDRVRRGAVVVRLDDAALQSAQGAAAAESSAAEADLDRARALLERGAATPREHDQAAARAAAARAALASVREDLSYAVLRAPFDGVVAARPVNVGDVAAPGVPLLEIEGDGGLEVRATVDGAAAASLGTGQRLAAEVDGQSAPVAATVRSIAPMADPSTHRVEVRADLVPAAGLRSGLFARLLVPREGAPALGVPSSAIVRRGGLTGIFVVAEGRARLRWVAVGASGETVTEVRAGAAAGEPVVLDPAGLADGARVEAAR